MICGNDNIAEVRPSLTTHGKFSTSPIKLVKTGAMNCIYDGLRAPPRVGACERGVARRRHGGGTLPSAAPHPAHSHIDNTHQIDTETVQIARYQHQQHFILITDPSYALRTAIMSGLMFVSCRRLSRKF